MDYLPHEADIAEQLEHLISGVNLSYDLFTNGKYDKLTLYASAQHVDRDSYYGAEQDPNAYGHTKNLTYSAGGYYSFNMNRLLFNNSTTLIGFDNTKDYLKDTKLGANGRSNTLLTRQSVNTLGTFLQQNWKSNKVNLGIGMRYDYYWVNDLESDIGDINNGVWIPRINILYKFTKDFRFRIGYARGYRAPQVFNEDLHIELVNANRVETFNSDNLKQETSDSFTASINSVFNIEHSYHDLLIEGFYTRLNDPFANTYFPLGDQGNFAYLRVNAEDGAYVSGVNMEWKSFLSNKLETQLGFTIQTSRYESPQPWGEEDNSTSKKFMRTPDKYGYATFIWRPSHHFNASLSLNYTGSMLVPHFGLNPDDFDNPEEAQKVEEAINRGDIISGEQLEESSAFIVADLLVSYDIHLTNETELQFFLGMKNIFNQLQDDYDKGIYRDAGYIYGPSQPRTINFGIKFGNVF